MSGDGVLLATTFAAGVQVAQGFLQNKRSAEYHETEVELTRKQHAEDLRLAKKIHEDDIRVAHRYVQSAACGAASPPLHSTRDSKCHMLYSVLAYCIGSYH